MPVYSVGAHLIIFHPALIYLAVVSRLSLSTSKTTRHHAFMHAKGLSASSAELRAA